MKNKWEVGSEFIKGTMYYFVYRLIDCTAKREFASDVYELSEFYTNPYDAEDAVGALNNIES